MLLLPKDISATDRLRWYLAIAYSFNVHQSLIIFTLPTADAKLTKLVTGIFNAVGTGVTVDESKLDAVTGLSGSGPAYGFIMIEALADGGVRMGLPRSTALQLAAQTMLGAAKMVLETGKHPGLLKDQVCSPGGTTIAGVHQLELGGVRSSLMNAVQAATNKASELGKKS